MSKSISPALLLHKSGTTTTLAMLMKVGPLPDESFLCFTSLDHQITYDDGTGDGPLVYEASTGMEEANFAAGADLSVDNSEAKTLTPVYPNTGITYPMVDNGELDGIEFVVMQVNYMDLTMGHEIMANGPIGEVKIARGGLITVELRAWSQLLKQNSVVVYYSKTCRAIFGSQAEQDSSGEAVIERYPCNYDIRPEWVEDVVVTSVGTESVRQFTAASLGQADDYFAPGLVRWLSGDNAGQYNEIEDFSAGGVFALQHTTRNAIQIGDTFDVRRDCTKRWSGHNSCQTYANRQWFRGEPFIPIGDTIALNVPGVAGGTNSGGTGE